MAKILLVEDDNNLREIYEARLQAEGYDIVAAQDGEEALAVAKKEKPDLIISDVMMPRISGFEMLDILRNTEGIKDVKVIMLTALGQTEDKSRADTLGADRYLVKSQVTLEDIVNTAAVLMNGGEVPAPAATSEPPATPAPVPTATIPVTAPPEPALTPTPPTPPAVPATPPPPTVAPPPSPAPAPPVLAQQSPAPSTPAPAPTQVPITPNPVPEPTTPPIAPAAPPAPPTSPVQEAQVPPESAAQEQVQASTPQPVSEEQATMQAQIDQFASQPAPTPPPAVTPPDETGNNGIVADAVKNLISSTEQTPETVTPSPAPSATASIPAPLTPTPPTPPAVPPPLPTPPPPNEPSVPPAPPTANADTDNDNNVTIANKKIIRPLQPGDESPRPNLDELLAKEGMAPMGDQQAVPDHPPGFAGVVNADGSPHMPHQPGHVIAPNPTTEDGKPIDPSSIAL
ncbi:MAG TPA: response regulator [Candidatus Saccharimonadales bacterium]|nr:response regulator [Candidatus Saccharimonadales bacterium]